MNNEAFVYCWTDSKTNKLYVGSHVGSVDDGYVSSSRHFMAEYKQRPEDFSRQIIAHGNRDDVRSLESSILNSIDAASNRSFYNLHNNNGKFFVTDDSHKRSVITRKRKRLNWHSQETIHKIREANTGKKHTVESKKKMSALKKVNHPHRGKDGPTKNRKWFTDPINNKSYLIVPGTQPLEFIQGRCDVSKDA